MKNAKKRPLVIVLAALFGTAGTGLWAGEHPEHPKEKKAMAAEDHEKHEHPDKAAKAEHPEHPKSGAKPVTLEDVAMSAAKWAKKEQKKSGGRLTVRDEKQGKDLKLKFVKIHKERLSKTADDTYFVCADFKDQDGQVYDMDIFMKGMDAKELEPASDLKLHKQNGKARYGWVEKDGKWMTEEAK